MKPFMRKCLYIILLLCFSSLVLCSQDLTPIQKLPQSEAQVSSSWSKWNIGLSLALSFRPTYSSYSPLNLALTPGAWFSYRFHSGFALQTGFNYRYADHAYNIQKTASTTSTNMITGQETEIFTSRTWHGYQAWQVPILMKFIKNNWQWYVGPYLMHFQERSKTRFVSNGPPDAAANQRLRAEIANSIIRLDYGVTLGASIALRKRINLDLQANQGFRDLTPNEWYQNRQQHFFTNLQLGIQYRL